MSLNWRNNEFHIGAKSLIGSAIVRYSPPGSLISPVVDLLINAHLHRVSRWWKRFCSDDVITQRCHLYDFHSFLELLSCFFLKFYYCYYHYTLLLRQFRSKFCAKSKKNWFFSGFLVISLAMFLRPFFWSKLLVFKVSFTLISHASNFWFWF